MISVYFFPKKERLYKDGTCPVFMQVSYNGNRIRRPVQGVRINPKHWVSDKGRVKKPSKTEVDNNYQEFNTRLDEIQGRINEANKYILINKVRLTEKFILDWLYKENSIQISKKVFEPIFDEYLNAIRPNSAERTILGKTTVKNFILAYQEAKKTELHLSDFDQDFFEKIRAYAYDDKKVGANYFAKITTTLKTFLYWAVDKGYTDNLRFKKFSAPEKETEVIYLTEEELKALYNFDFKSARLRHVRDIYCFCCFTGLRISDVRDLSVHNIQDGQIVKMIKKTQDVSVIPLSKFAIEILEKYKGSPREPLPKISTQKFNDYIKDCCEAAGITTPTMIVRFSGGKRTVETLPKYELITSHTARKTFATNSLILGMSPMTVRNFLGHKKEETFRRYVKIADNVKKSEMSKTWDALSL